MCVEVGDSVVSRWCGYWATFDLYLLVFCFFPLLQRLFIRLRSHTSSFKQIKYLTRKGCPPWSIDLGEHPFSSLSPFRRATNPPGNSPFGPLQLRLTQIPTAVRPLQHSLSPFRRANPPGNYPFWPLQLRRRRFYGLLSRPFRGPYSPRFRPFGGLMRR